MSFHDLHGFLARPYPQGEGMVRVVAHFDQLRRAALPPPRIGPRNGYWHGEPGMSLPGA